VNYLPYGFLGPYILNCAVNSALSSNYDHKQPIALKICCKFIENFKNILIIKIHFFKGYRDLNPQFGVSDIQKNIQSS
jgi:hypothetical protein